MSVLNIDAYPCRWPDGWSQTPDYKRQSSRYQLDFVRARDDISRQLKLLGAHEIVLTTNIPLRRDGLPLAGQSEPRDPAVAVYWTERVWNPQRNDYAYTQRVIACDHWQKVKENLRAVGVAIEALRALKRSGATQVSDRAFMGFNALPNPDTKKSWRDVLGFGVSTPTRVMVDQRFRELSLRNHPDHGGSGDMGALVRARDEALRELG